MGFVRSAVPPQMEAAESLGNEIAAVKSQQDVLCLPLLQKLADSEQVRNVCAGSSTPRPPPPPVRFASRAGRDRPRPRQLAAETVANLGAELASVRNQQVTCVGQSTAIS